MAEAFPDLIILSNKSSDLLSLIFSLRTGHCEWRLGDAEGQVNEEDLGERAQALKSHDNPQGDSPSYLHDGGGGWGCPILLQVLAMLPRKSPGCRRWLCPPMSILRQWPIGQQREIFPFHHQSATQLLQTRLYLLGNFATGPVLLLPCAPYNSCTKSCLQRWMLLLSLTQSTVFCIKE